MQKKLIALAIAGLTAVPAFAADSAVTLYGLVDMGYSWRGDNYADGVKSRSGFDSGQMNGTRLGLRGYETLAPGLSAIFTIEAGIAADTGASNQGRAWGRQTFAGLDYKGTKVTLGHQYTPQFNMYAAYEPFSLGSVAQINNIFTHIEARAQNSVAVSTPFFGNDKFGFAVEGMYSLDSPQGDGAVESETGAAYPAGTADLRYGSIFPKVKFGPATLLAGYTQWKVKGGQGHNSAVDVGLNLDFKVVQLFGAYARYNNGVIDNDGTKFTVNDEKLKYDRWFVGGNVPLGNFNLLASYAYSKDKNDQNLKAQQIGVGGLYNLSKRTAFYAVYSKILTSDGIESANNVWYAPEVGDATNVGSDYRAGVNLGLRHTF